MRTLLLADDDVGLEVTRWLAQEYRNDLAAVVTTSENAIARCARDAGIPAFIESDSGGIVRTVEPLGSVDLGILAWWPKIIKPCLLEISREGFLNLHPSLLPHNRGKNYSFWAIVEEAPFGVSLHIVDEGVDTGPIVAQLPLEYDWTDTGETLFYRAKSAIIDLFKETYPRIRTGQCTRTPQDLSAGSSHHSRELDPASELRLGASENVRHLLNRLRARTFEGRPACWFEEDGRIYEVRVSITERT